MKSINYILLPYLLRFIISHSWLDCVDIQEDGCHGYVRGYVGHLDDPMTYRIEFRNNEQLVCNPKIESSPENYSTKYPRTKAKPGQTLKFSYLENGHVTKDRLPPDNKPNPKTYSIHWSGKPAGADSSQIMYRGDLNKDNQLGNDYNFDDGQCAEDNTKGRNGPSPCYGNLNLPKDLAPGVYQFIWWWKFDKDPKAGGEEYTSCFDVEIVEDKKTLNSTAYTKNYAYNQPTKNYAYNHPTKIVNVEPTTVVKISSNMNSTNEDCNYNYNYNYKQNQNKKSNLDSLENKNNLNENNDEQISNNNTELNNNNNLQTSTNIQSNDNKQDRTISQADELAWQKNFELQHKNVIA